MDYSALWIDHQQASLFTFKAKEIIEENIFIEPRAQHDRNPFEGVPNDTKDKGFEKFYHRVAEKCQEIEKLMIMGPGEAKNEFKHHCENHHHKKLAHSIVGVESIAAHTSKGEIVQKAELFFKDYQRWAKKV